MKHRYAELNAKNNSIHCNDCEARINRVLGVERGILSVKASHKTQEIRVYFDQELINLNMIKQKLENMGFPIE
ncbi:MAG: heavy-metal-associated domain-containing protein [Promethearchaeota archaeon]